MASCKTCQGSFNKEDRCPRVLDCGHTFCTKCIMFLSNPASQSITCPEDDNIVTRLVNGLPYHLPWDLAVLSTLQAYDIENARGDVEDYCQVCDGSRHPASAVCLVCDERMCEAMAVAHRQMKATRGHDLVGMESFSLANQASTEIVQTKCVKHPGEPPIAYDTQCCQILCGRCTAFGAHSNHPYQPLQEVALEFRAELSKSIQACTEVLAEIETNEPIGANVQDALTRNFSALEAQIGGVFDEVRQLLDERQKQLASQLRNFFKDKQFDVHDQRQCLENKKACVQHCLNLAKTLTETSSASLVIAVGAQLRSAHTHGHSKNVRARLDELSRDVVVEFEALGHLKSVFKDFGKVVLVPAPAAPGSTGNAESTKVAIADVIKVAQADGANTDWIQVAKAFEQLFKNSQGLGNLSLTNQPIQPETCRALAEALNHGNLTSLSLSESGIADVGARALGDALAANRTLQNLFLHKNAIGDVGGSALGRALLTNRNLTALYLNSNRINDQGAIDIASGLAANLSLTRLYLNDNQIGDVGGVALGRALCSNTKLTGLYLNNNQLGDESAKQFGVAIASNTTLIQLVLHANQITDGGIIGLARGLQQNQRLSTLYLARKSNTRLAP
eukprot:c16853_g1_i1.p1 GENE.c16853_g1_i1~~c16853_g1_i1.p1  ORF type:complete len:619 (+),score=121.44 c16853_g1_i1:48-1904(+)